MKRGITLPFYVSEDDPPARREILLAAMKLFTERGLSRTTIRDIADESGFTNPALYRHFKSKEALALYIFETSYTRILQNLDQALALAPDGPEKLAAYVRRSVELFAEHPESFLFINDQLRELWPHVPKRMRNRTLVTQAYELVSAVSGDTSPSQRADLAVAALLGTFSQWARLMHFGELPGPPASWIPELTRAAMRILG